MKTKIQNIDDLRLEILRLRLKRVEQENDLQLEAQKITAQFRYPVMLLTKLNDWFGVFAGDDEDNKDKKDQHWVMNALHLGLPLFVDKFLFPKSGIILKSLIVLVSQKAAKTVNKDMFNDLIDKLSDWIKPAEAKPRNKKVLPEYGIPPDSETY